MSCINPPKKQITILIGEWEYCDSKHPYNEHIETYIRYLRSQGYECLNMITTDPSSRYRVSDALFDAIQHHFDIIAPFIMNGYRYGFSKNTFRANSKLYLFIDKANSDYVIRVFNEMGYKDELTFVESQYNDVSSSSDET